jgi:hypothetical protein
VANILKKHGIEPAPERERRTTWREFLQCHWDLIVAADFFDRGVDLQRATTLRGAVLYGLVHGESPHFGPI